VADIDYNKKIYDDITNRILLNYELTESLVPPKLKKEFKNKILPWKYIKTSLLPLIVKSKKLELKILQDHIKLELADRIGSRNFGLKCEALGILPEELFAELIRDIFSVNS
jgi:GTP-sensing pleiotropic transcriptional regulator CodY